MLLQDLTFCKISHISKISEIIYKFANLSDSLQKMPSPIAPLSQIFAVKLPFISIKPKLNFH